MRLTPTQIVMQEIKHITCDHHVHVTGSLGGVENLTLPLKILKVMMCACWLCVPSEVYSYLAIELGPFCGVLTLCVLQWTDDTSMALCLAESLVECKGFNPLDQMKRYWRWYQVKIASNCKDL